METNEIARARTLKGGQRPPVRPIPLSCGDCQFVTFVRYELQEHLTTSGHKKPGFPRRVKRSLIEITMAAALISLGAISLGAVMAALIWSAKILVFLGIPALLVLAWWIRRG